MPPASRYPVPEGECRTTDEIKGSRFIATAAYSPGTEEAKSFVHRMKAEFSDASHNCWAYVVGPPGETGKSGASDDGEPGGTAGTPMLNVLLKSGIGDVVVVVTRYFGGVKLGRGGLVRAYGGAVRRVLDAITIRVRIFYVPFQLTVAYSFVEPVRRLVAEHNCEIKQERFGAEAVFELDVPEEERESLLSSLTDLTRGRVQLKKSQER